MNTRGIDKIIENVGRWEPSDLAFVEQVQIVTSPLDDASLTMKGVMQRRDLAPQGWPSPDVPSFRVTVRFTGVQKLSLQDFGPGPKQISGFDIIDISKDGWDEMNYRIEDYEEGQISFYCRNFDVIGCEPNVA